MGFRLHTSQGLWIFLQNFSCHLWEPCQPSHALYSLPVSLWWCGFFHMSLVIRFLSSYCSVYYSGWFFFNLVVIPLWSWEDVSVTSTYSSAIWGLTSMNILAIDFHEGLAVSFYLPFTLLTLFLDILLFIFYYE